LQHDLLASITLDLHFSFGSSLLILHFRVCVRRREEEKGKGKSGMREAERKGDRGRELIKDKALGVRRKKERTKGSWKG
jgi:hypothetical protein